jgi:hypothetical protein
MDQVDEHQTTTPLSKAPSDPIEISPVSQSQTPPKRYFLNAMVIGLISIIIVILLILFFERKQSQQTLERINPNQSLTEITPTNQKVDTSAWKTYTMKVEKLSFSYPPSWTITDKLNEYDKGSENLYINGPHMFTVGIYIDPSVIDFLCHNAADKSCSGRESFSHHDTIHYAYEPVEIMNSSLYFTIFSNNPKYPQLGVTAYKNCQFEMCQNGLGIGKYIHGDLQTVALYQKQTISTTQFINDPNVPLAKTIFSSLHY